MNLKEKQVSYLSNELPKLYKVIYKIRLDIECVIDDWSYKKDQIEDKLLELKHPSQIASQKELLDKLMEILQSSSQLTETIESDVEVVLEELTDDLQYWGDDLDSIDLDNIKGKLDAILNNLYTIIVQFEELNSMKRGLASHTKRLKAFVLEIEKALEKLDIKTTLIEDTYCAIGTRNLQQGNIEVVVGRCPVCSNYLDEFSFICPQCGFDEPNVETVAVDEYLNWRHKAENYRETLFGNLSFELVDNRLMCEDPFEAEDYLASQLEEAEECIVVAYNGLTKEYMWIPNKLLEIIPHKSIVEGDLIENFKQFRLHIGEGLTLGVEERTSKNGAKEFVVFASDSDYYEKTKIIVEEDFRYFASLLFNWEHEGGCVQDWEQNEFEPSILIPQYNAEQIDYIYRFGAPVFDMEIGFYDFPMLKLSGIRTKKIQDFIRRIFFNVDEINRIVMDHLLCFSSYVVPLGIVRIYDKIDF